jgi:hypothetical protein
MFLVILSGHITGICWKYYWWYIKRVVSRCCSFGVFGVKRLWKIAPWIARNNSNHRRIIMIFSNGNRNWNLLIHCSLVKSEQESHYIHEDVHASLERKCRGSPSISYHLPPMVVQYHYDCKRNVWCKFQGLERRWTAVYNPMSNRLKSPIYGRRSSMNAFDWTQCLMATQTSEHTVPLRMISIVHYATYWPLYC